MKVCIYCDARFEAVDWLCPACDRSPPTHGVPVLSPPLEEFSEPFDWGVFRDLTELELDNEWFAVRNDVIVWALRTYFPSARNMLELGCGVGTVLSAVKAAFPGLALTGGDPFPACVEIAAERLSGVELLQLNASRIPYEGEFDVIGAFDVLEHIDDDLQALVQARRALRPGGGLLLAVPQHRWLWSAADDYALHVRRYRRRELVARLRTAGFRVLHTTSFVTSLLPLMLVSRLLQRDLQSYDPRKELSTPPWLRPILRAGLRADRMVLERGLRLPLGGSLLVVARAADPV